jgi:hypothetical protein
MTDFIVAENYHLRLKPATAKILIEKISLSFNADMNYKTMNHMHTKTFYLTKSFHCRSFLSSFPSLSPFSETITKISDATVSLLP